MRRFALTFALLLSCAATARAQTVLCESFAGAYRECRVASSGVVQLVSEVSEMACHEGTTWGTLSPGVVWVRRGCRAMFTIYKPKGTAAAPDKLIRCESSGGREVCPADLTNGLTFEKQLSRSACVEGETWGFDAERELIWVDRGCRAEFLVHGKPRAVAHALTCESEGEARKSCPAATEFGVALVRQMSATECAQGRTWGFDASGVWVSGGCRAQFALGGYRLPPNAVPSSATRLRCESADGERKVCSANAAHGVGLVRQLGATTCVLNGNWGYDANGIWVADGCRAEFAVAR
ncbi:MAG: DUF3011 domain-containing protein [Acidobacteriota bacterium]|nr:DUF3011 domain-containing protein [Acidobacteriota bacterium]